jgi:hypothetical protein
MKFYYVDTNKNRDWNDVADPLPVANDFVTDESVWQTTHVVVFVHAKDWDAFTENQFAQLHNWHPKTLSLVFFSGGTEWKERIPEIAARVLSKNIIAKVTFLDQHVSAPQTTFGPLVRAGKKNRAPLDVDEYFSEELGILCAAFDMLLEVYLLSHLPPAKVPDRLKPLAQQCRDSNASNAPSYWQPVMNNASLDPRLWPHLYEQSLDSLIYWRAAAEPLATDAAAQAEHWLLGRGADQ